ncbi:mCG67013, partial [Mus musculus]
VLAIKSGPCACWANTLLTKLDPSQDTGCFWGQRTSCVGWNSTLARITKFLRLPEGARVPSLFLLPRPQWSAPRILQTARYAKASAYRSHRSTACS